ncbi:MAG: transporter substrate-binding domain-containing protein [Hyphomicrobiales bacterium]|nr:transporter substrate-binding domain-containing protein [Hyphomicrobiales bacterium]
MRLGQLVVASLFLTLLSPPGLNAQDRVIALSDEEVAWLQGNPRVRVHNETNWPPFNFAANGRPQGYSIDIMNLVAGKVGLEVEYVTGPTWNEFLEMMKTGDLDVMLNIVRTPDRLEYLLYTPPYAKNPNAILSRKDGYFASMQELHGHTVSVPRGFFYEEVLKRDFPEIHVQTTDDVLGSMKAVSFGTADAAFGELAVFQYLMEENLITDLVVSGEVQLGDPEFELLNIATRRDLPILASVLTKAVNAVTQEEKRSIQARWFPGAGAPDSKQPDVESPRAISNQQILMLLALSVGLLVLFGLVVMLLGRESRDRDFSKFFGSQSFRISILAGLSILVAVVAVLNWLAISENKKHTEAKTERELSIVLASTIDRLNAWVRDRKSFLRQVGRDPELVGVTRALLAVERNPSALARSDALAQARAYFASNSQFGGAGFFIIAPDRISIGSRRDANIGTANFIAERRPELIDWAFAGSTVFVPPIRSDVVVGDGLEKRPLSMFFAAPVTDHDGDVIAVVTERVLPDGALSEILRAGRIGLSGEAYAVNSDGNMVSESRFVDQLVEIGLLEERDTELAEIPVVDPGRDLTQTIRSDVSVADRPPTVMMAGALEIRGETGAADTAGALQVSSNIDGYRDYRGVPVVGVWTWMPNLDLGLTVEIDLAEALTDFANFRFNLLAISGITTVLAIGATLFTLLVGQRAHRSLSLARDNLEARVEQRTQELSEAYGVITDSINYASNIQRAMLPIEQAMSGAFEDSFIIWQPRDVVGGDIYFLRQWGGGTLLVVADCTGHGVPGAFVTLISSGSLDRALDQVPPGAVGPLMQQVHKHVQVSLGQDIADGASNDGLELAVVYTEPGKSELRFGGACLDLFKVEDGAISAIKGTRKGIGYRETPCDHTWDETVVSANPGTKFYLVTDGLIDQVGGERRIAFGKRRFRSLVMEISRLPMHEQKERIEAALARYQGDELRRDDVSAIGFTGLK